jgi:hypothetical protein
MRKLVRFPLLYIFEHAPRSEGMDEGVDSSDDMSSPNWEDLTPYDWKMLCRSVLLISDNKTFCGSFRRGKVLVENFASTIVVVTSYCGLDLDGYYSQGSARDASKVLNLASDRVFPFETTDQSTGQWPANPSLFPVFRLPVPATLSHSRHWGRLAWMYCEFVETQE